MPTGPAAREAEALACAPRAFRTQPEPSGIVQGATSEKKTMFATGDTLVIGDFAEGALAPGQQYYVRRSLPPYDRSDDVQKAWIDVHTAGWIRITSVEGGRALASVTYVCDAIDPTDYLVPFEVPVVPEPLTDERDPDFESPGEILFGPDRRANHGGGDYVAIDHGTDDGVRAGQHVVFFRREGSEANARTLLGTGLVVEARSVSATVLIEAADAPIFSGDAVAFRR